MKPYFIGLLILTVAMAAYSQETTNMNREPSQVKAGQNFTIRVESNPTTGYSQGTTNPSEPIQVKVGQKFTIRVQSNPTTGYSWQLSKALDNKIILVTNAYIPPDSKLMGAGGYEKWTFKAINEGQTEISMKYVRPWEKDQPARTNVFTVVVK